ncbi:MAG: radical SAM/Cys-rich domain protein [Candidatus Latescibacteria bacterium]|nr:radical SAM/Cys-rich domain protein [Candidatus Latescibacterota bacterium]MBT4139034.1 radical SAM/Cys-rich domain protein [Candidatus Latescibacterota bacterium]
MIDVAGNSNEVLQIVEPGQPAEQDDFTTFATRVADHGQVLNRLCLDTLQINVGKLCNQACHHCHVDASPIRTEIMTKETVDHLLEFLSQSKVQAVDLTGGAPELNPHFRYFVERIRQMGIKVMVRCNLTVIFEPGMEDLPAFYKRHDIELVCSLPCYLEDNVDEQRGRGVYQKSIDALRTLNAIGYGQENSGLFLHLVYNPVGTSLPPGQEELEADYKRELKARFGIVFNSLYTITNMPIKRFGDFLKRRGLYQHYMNTLVQNFNVQTLNGVMCRSLVSIDWEGNIYDCDFNQMLEMHTFDQPMKVWDLIPEELIGDKIRVGNHCFGCTAGAGSSCGGELV